MFEFATILALMTSSAAVAFAISNHRRGKRLKAYIEEMSGSNERYRASLNERMDQCLSSTGGAAEQRAAECEQRLAALEAWRPDCKREVDHLRTETQNLAMLPSLHPERLTLANELRPRLASITDKLEPVLFPNQLAFDELDWMYRLRDRKFPYSLTFEEGMLFHYLVASNDLKRGYEIATAFGMSSFFIATAMQKTGGHLVSADAYIEEEMEDFLYDHEATKAHVDKIAQLQQQKRHSKLPRGLQFAIEGAMELQVEEHVDYRIACSPEGVPELLDGYLPKGSLLDFAFIDGGHFGEQPILDVKSVLPYLDRDRFLMMFHDTQCEAVARAVHFAADETGVSPFSIHTRNRITAVARGIDESTLHRCREMTVRQYV